MNRRKALIFTAVTASMLAWRLPALAQQKVTPATIGWLSTGTAEGSAGLLTAFKQKMATLGRKEGEDYVIVEAFAQSRTDRFPVVAKELAGKKPAVIIATSGQATSAASVAAPTTPIVMVGGVDPVVAGFARSLAKPGGMITGISNNTADLSEKYLDFLRLAVPGLTQVGFLVDSRNPTRATLVEGARRSAAHYKIAARIAEIANPEDVDTAIARLAKEGAQALVVFSSPTLFFVQGRILELAAKHRWAVIGNARSWAGNGALLSYGIDSSQIFGRAAYYVDRILQGEKPGELAIEQPSKLEFLVNLKAAKALGIKIPQSVLVRADEVIQ
jgi:putative ABC transport system substrate-binding protein